MVVASATWIFVVLQPAITNLSTIAVMLAGLLLLVITLGFACARWGFTYSSSSGEKRGNDNVTL